MSKAMKRKHIKRKEIDDTLIKGEQQIVKILNCPGSNLHEVQNSNNENYLASLPSKFRKNIWIKRGNYVVVEPIKEGDKVKAEIVRTLNSDDIKILKSQNLWPDCFSDVKIKTNSEEFNSHFDL